MNIYSRCTEFARERKLGAAGGGGLYSIGDMYSISCMAVVV